LSVGYYLKQAGREFTILEKSDYPGSAWREDRWDSFCLNTPNWAFRLPGAEYDGGAPDAFMHLPEIITRFDRYAQQFDLPVQYGVQALGIDPVDGGYRVATSAGSVTARNVVTAAGLFQSPAFPPFASQLSGDIYQLHSGKYRNPHSLPDGGVLVIGSAQSGCQIAEELYQAGRQVYLSVGSAGRLPRRYRGRDIFYWLEQMGFFNRTADLLPGLADRFKANVQVSGTAGGHTINLHRFARDGVRLVGRLAGGAGDMIRFLPDLKQNLAYTDRFEQETLRQLDQLIERSGMTAPPDAVEPMRDGFTADEVTELDLRAAGINTIIWANGYRFDYRWIRLPVFDSAGFPISRQGETPSPGLYFAGLPWLPSMKTGLLLGVAENARHVAGQIMGERPDQAV
ncbi:MAG: NAD(P)-binding domain-containing protein, partial [Anaerolineaceae bacterium]